MDKKNRKQFSRPVIQVLAAMIQNANIKGFFIGKIYQGQTKSVCVPGLNCYSCPGAVGACPIGSLQNSLSAYSFKLPYYVLGLILFFGAIIGRAICGFICPFGFVQDLLHKLPHSKKIRTFKADQPLRKLKYVVLVIMVVLLPCLIKLTPVFCKYLCPSGTLAGILLCLSNTSLWSVLGGRFAWKVSILLIILITSTMIYRPFCKYLCPLGAIYGSLNKFSFLQMKLDTDRCIGCKRCYKACDMCVDPSEKPNDAECIRCGSCINACPVHALSFKLK